MYFHQPICETITILSRRLKQKIAYMKYFHKLKFLCPCGLLLSFFIMGHLKIEISNWSMGIWNFEYVPLLDSLGAHYVYDSHCNNGRSKCTLDKAPPLSSPCLTNGTNLWATRYDRINYIYNVRTKGALIFCRKRWLRTQSDWINQRACNSCSCTF